MKLYIDSANVEQIQKLNEYYPITGVTTNPSILVSEKRPYLEQLKQIRSVIGDEKELFVQALGETAEEIVEEGKYITAALSGKVILKVPATDEGIKAIRLLAEEQIPTLATTVYTAFQALIAAMAGANYVAPYVNRIDNLTGDGVKVVSNIVQLYKQYELPCQVLAASFKNVQQVHDVLLAGAESVTVSPEIIEKFIAFPSTKTDVADFKKAWQELYGRESTNLRNTK